MKPLNFLIILNLFFLAGFLKTTAQITPWENIGPYMAYINSMDMDNNHPDTLYAATDYGLYRSYDGAENWHFLKLPEKEINKVIVSQKETNRIMCSTEHTLYLSMDYGANWNVVFTDSLKLQCCVFNPENPNTLIIGQEAYGFQYSDEINYITRSTNNGQSWEKIYFNGVSFREEPYSIKYLIIDPSDTLKIYAGTENYLGGAMIISHDNGMEWDNIRLTGNGEQVYAMSCTPGEYTDPTLCAIASPKIAPDIYNRKLYLSKDGGFTWTEKSPPSSVDLLDNLNTESTMYISADYPEYIHIGADYSYEGGSTSLVLFNLEDESWRYAPDCPHNFPSCILSCNTADYLGFTEKGLYKYMDDNTWCAMNKGFSACEILDLACYPTSPYKILAAIEENLFKTDNLGNSWNNLKTTTYNKNSVYINPKDTSKLIAGTSPSNFLSYGSNFYIYKSKNGGNSWDSQVLFTRYGNITFDYKMWVSEIACFPNNTERIMIGIDGGDASAGAGLYLSENGGTTWDKVYSTGVSAICMDPADPDIVYLGTSSSGYVFRSEDGGKTWYKISPDGEENFPEHISDLAVNNMQQVFAATSSGLFKWEGDNTWSHIPGIPSVSLTAIAIDNSVTNPVFFAGTSAQGIFVSEDNGENWSSYNADLGCLNITKLKISSSYPKYLYAGTKEGGVWINLLQESPTHSQPFNKNEISVKVYPNPGHEIFNILLSGSGELTGTLNIKTLAGVSIYNENKVSLFPGEPYPINLNKYPSGNYILVFTYNRQTIRKNIMIIQ